MTSRAHVLQVVLSLTPGGTERLVMEICRRIAPDFRATVCCLDDEGPWATDLRNEGIEVIALRRPPGFRPDVGRRIAQVAADRGIRLAHCHQVLAVRLRPDRGMADAGAEAGLHRTWPVVRCASVLEAAPRQSAALPFRRHRCRGVARAARLHDQRALREPWARGDSQRHRPRTPAVGGGARRGTPSSRDRRRSVRRDDRRPARPGEGPGRHARRVRQGPRASARRPAGHRRRRTGAPAPRAACGQGRPEGFHRHDRLPLERARAAAGGRSLREQLDQRRGLDHDSRGHGGGPSRGGDARRRYARGLAERRRRHAGPGTRA